MTFEEIFYGRMVLIQAQKHHAQSHVRHDYEGRHFWTSESAEEAYSILEHSLCELEREFQAKRAKRKSSAAKTAA